MAQTAVQGKDVIIKILKGGEYVPSACATSVDYYKDRELIETSTVDSAGMSEFEYGFATWGLTLGGVTTIIPEGGAAAGITVFEMLQKQLNKDVADIELSFEDPQGNLKTLTGRVVIPHIGISAGAEGFSEDDIELKGTGVLTIDTVLIDPVDNESEVMKIEYTAAGGEDTLQDDALTGKLLSDILHVHRDVNVLLPIDTGTPTDKQVKFISASGTMVFASELMPDEDVLILYK